MVATVSHDARGDCALGLDAGGTSTRFVLLAAGGQVLAEGQGPAMSGTQLLDSGGRIGVDITLGGIARALPQLPRAVVAGITGYDHVLAPEMLPRLTQIFGVEAGSAKAMSDIELLCRAAFAPGDGIVVYAGTGSIAALLDAMGFLHRAGGRGGTIDDAGSGHWIAREALKRVWRAEDEEPGTWQRSALAQALFEQLGGNEWHHTRQWVYGGPGVSRGKLGELAGVVAAVAAKDAAAMALLEQAGRELARLPQALMRRYGRHPIAMAGRAFTLHAAVERGFTAALPAGTEITTMREEPHLAAARLALRLMPQAADRAVAGGVA
ncbi:MAG: ATPase [Burkholderiales bacterium]|nr:ATPase [Burkholderiales bacterium]